MWNMKLQPLQPLTLANALLKYSRNTIILTIDLSCLPDNYHGHIAREQFLGNIRSSFRATTPQTDFWPTEALLPALKKSIPTMDALRVSGS